MPKPAPAEGRYQVAMTAKHTGSSLVSATRTEGAGSDRAFFRLAELRAGGQRTAPGGRAQPKQSLHSAAANADGMLVSGRAPPARVVAISWRWGTWAGFGHRHSGRCTGGDPRPSDTGQLIAAGVEQRAWCSRSRWLRSR